MLTTLLSSRALVFSPRRSCLIAKKIKVKETLACTLPLLAPKLPTTRFYSSLPKDEEDKEVERVKLLSQNQRDKELKDLDKEIARLYTLRGINTGELYTFRGKFKALARDYGIAFMAWYWVVWTSTAALTYTAIEVGGIDAIALISKVDNLTGLEISKNLDPTIGTIGLTLAVNELLEPLRLPIVVFTTKPIVDRLTINK